MYKNVTIMVLFLALLVSIVTRPPTLKGYSEQYNHQQRISDRGWSLYNQSVLEILCLREKYYKLQDRLEHGK